MRKIFFIFAMLLMSVVSVWAEEKFEVVTMDIKGKNSYTIDHFEISGTALRGYGLLISNGNKITISAKGNEIITRVDYIFGYGNNKQNVIATPGNVDTDNNIVNNVNATSLEISSVNVSDPLTILQLVIYYTDEPIGNESEKTETFTTTSGNQYTGENINITATKSDSYGLEIANGKSVTITSNNGFDILKVDLHFKFYRPNTDTKIICDVSADITGSGDDWCIDNINKTSLTICHPGFGGNYNVQIDKITVYYAAPSAIDVAAANLEGAYWTTFYSDIANYQAPEGTHVYKVSLNDTKITMTEIEDRIVNMGQGVVLKNPTEGNLSMTKVDYESSGDYSDNNLVGTSTTITNPAPGNVYVLNYKNTKGLAFYKLSSNGTIKANRAYLLVPSGSSVSAQEFFAFDATVTGVDNINAQDSEEEKVYDLQGRRIAKPAKGVYIVNGKKVIMK